MIKILSDSLEELCTIEDLINPNIHEEINSTYTFSFSTMFDENTVFIKPPNIVEVDDDYFYIARVRRNHTTRGVEISVECEHVSYLMNEYENDIEEYEDTPAQIIAYLMGFTPQFMLNDCDFFDVVYFNPGKKSVRQCLFELANYVGGELVFNQYYVSLISQRGTDNGLELKIGENIVGITEEIDNRGDTYESYDIDVLDLSHLEGYEFLQKLNIGDTVRIVDPQLEIDIKLRVLSYDFNPFKKTLVHVQIGNLVRDFITYIKEVVEEVNKKVEPTPEPEPTNPYYLSEFRIGDEDCLIIPGVDITEKLRKQMTDGSPYTVDANVLYTDFDTMVGLFVSLKEKYNTFNLQIIESSIDGTNHLYTKDDLPALNTQKYPPSDGHTITIVAYQGEASGLTPKSDFQAYAVRFEKYIPDTDDYQIEFGKAVLTGTEITFKFENVYDDVMSVTVGTIGAV
ncbi:phage tail spike protein [Schinkia azotoformans]|uniref:phage tail spike protein n=1 Tax=Schinkia azotoformans TaxID=1454 RepID=UPI002E1B01C7|nr:phage tail spike protein [Schinkia azotoformans]MED4354067.1 phage tail spike protein [Schinkia azotoformans]